MLSVVNNAYGTDGCLEATYNNCSKWLSLMYIQKTSERNVVGQGRAQEGPFCQLPEYSQNDRVDDKVDEEHRELSEEKNATRAFMLQHWSRQNFRSGCGSSNPLLLKKRNVTQKKQGLVP